MDDHDFDSSNDTGELAEFEERLRRLPRPPVPPGLEDRLLAQIPAAPPRRRLRRVGPSIAAACLAAAAAVALMIVLRPAPPAIRSLATDLPAAKQCAAPQASAPIEEPAAPLPSTEDVMLAIEREGRAARMLALADILDAHPSGREQAKLNRRYVLSAYGDTRAAKALQDQPRPNTPTTNKENSNG